MPTKQKSPKNCNAPHNYTYTGRSGKEEVSLGYSYILREQLIALHMT
jgi:hypothetical protein